MDGALKINRKNEFLISMKYFTFLLILAVTVSSCNLIDGRRIKGNGKIITKTYDLNNFKSIDGEGAIHFYLVQDSNYSVKVETDENLMNHLEVKVNDGELEVGNRDRSWLSPSKEIKVFVSMPVIRSINVSGASSIKTEGKFVQDNEIAIDASGASDGELQVRAPKINLDASGASTISISGETKDVKGEATGASTIKAFDLKAENVNVEASGASTANVFASISLIADASGASGINYKGNPTVTSDASGASSVKKVD